ncbi:hypothetical protein [Heyndrickxia ginsengihumi]|uniref:Uncharacterized protein n=1 Tax=Heyndrickxia ginsengihumi TaxID=363870 RepID=A0A6M0P381_9BACI|nr:hypothetical protein [Heyndrickxia ginsengihumi]MBE6183419.1 hypothetical protein [Bacillus sp. (in: firmicutes)]MCM3022402.1 hypothetical protein [Heyndrickxia ginsengihumi]NEY18655.1 hypothetical protein [Heyndrickxia ginsengihumi]
MLSYQDIYHHFKTTQGVKDFAMNFHTVSIFANVQQPKGLFIALEEEPDLLTAISNGAIAAIWKKDQLVPKYTPNDFPIIFVDDPASALEQIGEEYIKNIESKGYEMSTSFVFKAPNHSNEPYTYDFSTNHSRESFLSTLKGKRRG